MVWLRKKQQPPLTDYTVTVSERVGNAGCGLIAVAIAFYFICMGVAALIGALR